MEFKKICDFGSKVEIRTTNGTSISVLVYEKGRDYAKRYLSLNRGTNVSLPKIKRLELAGVKEIKDPKLVCACCYAKKVYDAVTQNKDKDVNLQDLKAKINRKIKRQVPIAIIQDTQNSDLSTKVAINAKNFITQKENEQELTWATLGLTSSNENEG